MKSFFSLVFSLIILSGMHCLNAQDNKPKLTPVPKPPATTSLKPTTSPKPTNTIQLIANNMVYIPGGRFTMGCLAGENCYENEKPHQVTVSSYYIGKYEVTQAQWHSVMGSNPSRFAGCDNCPVEKVSWDDIQGFIKKLNQKTGMNYRLPTEAEWEYAARGGNRSRGYIFSGSNDLDYVAWNGNNSGYKTNPVGKKQANELGLYDMSGNVWEWCSDWYGENYYRYSPSTDPQGPGSGDWRVVRGGSWINPGFDCRVFYRLSESTAPNLRDDSLGFRLARD